MRLSALYFVLLSLLASSLSEPDIEQSLANFRRALGTKLLTVDAVPPPAPAPPTLIVTAAKPVHTNLGIIQNYLGTETNNETAEAIQGANNLVSSGILPGFKPIEELSPLSESNPNYSGSKKPCHHKEDVTSNKDTLLKPFSDNDNNNTTVPQTPKPCRHKEPSTQKPLTQTETPLQPNKESNSDSTPVTKKPCHHKQPAGQTNNSTVALTSNNDKVEVVEEHPVPSPKPCHHSSVQTTTSTVVLTSNNDKVQIVEEQPVLSSIPEAPQLPPWQAPVSGQVIVEETAYVPGNQVTIVQPGLSISSSSSHDCNKDKIEIVGHPILSPIPPAPALPPWHIPIAGQVIVEETSYVPDNLVNFVQPGLSISSSSHDCNKDKIEIVDRPILSPIPPAPLLPPWQVPAFGQIVVEETSYIPNEQVAIVQHVPSPIPVPPQIPPVWQAIVEENSYVSNSPCPNKTNINNKQNVPSRFMFPSVDRTNIVYNQGFVNLPPILNDPPFNVVPLPVPSAVEIKVPAKVTLPQPVIETLAEPLLAPAVVDVPSSYTYQQVKGDGSLETTFALQDGVHTRYAPNPYRDINKFYEYFQRPANFVTTNVNSYHDRVYPYVQSQYDPYPHNNLGFNEYDRPFEYNQYPVAHQIPQRPYNLYPPGFNNSPRPQVNNYQPGHHVHPQSFNHPQQPSYGGYSYKQIHSDGSITSHGSDGNVQTLESLQMSANKEAEKNPASQATFAYNPPRSFNYPQQQMSDNFVQPSSTGYSYKQVHSDGSVTSYQGSNGNVQTFQSGSPQLTASKVVAKKSAPQVPYANNVMRQQQNIDVYPNQMEMIGDISPGYNPMVAQETMNPMFFSYMFKQLGFNGASIDSGSKALPSPAKLPLVNTNVKRPESVVSSASNTVSVNPSSNNNVHVTSYSGFTNGNDKWTQTNSESGGSATNGFTSNVDKGTSEVKLSSPGFKVAYGEKTASKNRPIEYNPIIVLDTTTNRGNYYYGQSNSDGTKTEYMGDKERVVVQNVDDSPKVNERRKFRGDIPEAY